MTKSRSSEQNALMWSLLTQLSEQVVYHGKKRTKEVWKQLITAHCHGYEMIPALDEDKVLVVGFSTSKMNTEQLSNVIECAYAIGALHGVDFKENEPLSS